MTAAIAVFMFLVLCMLGFWPGLAVVIVLGLLLVRLL